MNVQPTKLAIPQKPRVCSQNNQHALFLQFHQACRRNLKLPSMTTMMNLRKSALSFLALIQLSSVPKAAGIPQGLPNPGRGQAYEVWACDQSNTEAGQEALGIKGGFLWIYDSESIEQQLRGHGDALPLSCTPSQATGPCNMLDVFPQALKEFGASGMRTDNTLGGLNEFGRLHGVIHDPFNRYVNVNLFTPGGGYIGVIDTVTKEAIGLFRVTQFSFDPSLTRRSVHMSFWAADGSAIVVANLQGKAIERINVLRDDSNTITGLQFDRSASLGLGRGMSVATEATVFLGRNAFGNPMIGEIVGDYANADLGDLTPNGVCKENGCTAGQDGAMGGRANNVPICPVPSNVNGNIYITLGGGGILIANIFETPMKITGEYGQNIVFGAGCAGAQSGDTMFMDGGISASGAGATQSTFAVFAFDDNGYDVGTNNPENAPLVVTAYEDTDTNTATIGNLNGVSGENLSGQIPGTTTRRDAHGAAVTMNGRYVHFVDRIQNVVEVIDAETHDRTTYDLTSESGQDGLDGYPGPCFFKSVSDDGDLPINDPAPDLMETAPDGKYLMIAFRGPSPVTVNHSAQGSCPGVGIVRLAQGGRSGRLVDVLRTTNQTPDLVKVVAAPGGHAYTGSERSDVHGTIVVGAPVYD